jgi:Protein of unknown function (DUF2958)
VTGEAGSLVVDRVMVMMVSMDKDLVDQLRANQLALETKIAWFEDLQPVCRFRSGEITWLLVTLSDYNIIGGLVDWGYGFLPFDRVEISDCLNGLPPMQCQPVHDVEFYTQWPVSAYLAKAKRRPVVVEKRNRRLPVTGRL